MSERLKGYVHRRKVLGIKICNNFTTVCIHFQNSKQEKTFFDHAYIFLSLAYRIDIFVHVECGM